MQPEVAREAYERIQTEHRDNCTAKVVVGDSRSLNMDKLLESVGIKKVQFVIMHPPYWDIIKFSESEKDLSNSPTLDNFLESFGQVIDNSTKYLDFSFKKFVCFPDFFLYFLQ